MRSPMNTPEEFSRAAETAVALAGASYDQLDADPADLMDHADVFHVACTLATMLGGLLHCMPEHQARGLLRDWGVVAQRGRRPGSSEPDGA